MILTTRRVFLAALILSTLSTENATAQRLFVTNNLTNNAPGGRILEFDGQTGIFMGLVASIDTPSGIAMGPDGALYVASATGQSVLRFDSSGQQTTFVAPRAGGLAFPDAITFGRDGNLYVTSFEQQPTVLRFDGNTGDFIDTFATKSLPSFPMDIEFGPDGNLYMSLFRGGVARFDGLTGVYLGPFVGADTLDRAGGITFGPDDNLYVADYAQNSVNKYDGSSGAFIEDFVSAGSGGLDHANAIKFGPDGNLYVAGLFSDQIVRFDGYSGAFIDVFAGGPIDAPQDFVFFVPEPSTLSCWSWFLLWTFCRWRQTTIGRRI